MAPKQTKAPKQTVKQATPSASSKITPMRKKNSGNVVLHAEAPLWLCERRAQAETYDARPAGAIHRTRGLQGLRVLAEEQHALQLVLLHGGPTDEQPTDCRHGTRDRLESQPYAHAALSGRLSFPTKFKIVPCFFASLTIVRTGPS